MFQNVWDETENPGPKCVLVFKNNDSNINVTTQKTYYFLYFCNNSLKISRSLTLHFMLHKSSRIIWLYSGLK